MGRSTVLGAVPSALAAAFSRGPGWPLWPWPCAGGQDVGCGDRRPSGSIHQAEFSSGAAWLVVAAAADAAAAAAFPSQPPLDRVLRRAARHQLLPDHASHA